MSFSMASSSVNVWSGAQTSPSLARFGLSSDLEDLKTRGETLQGAKCAGMCLLSCWQQIQNMQTVRFVCRQQCITLPSYIWNTLHLMFSLKAFGKIQPLPPLYPKRKYPLITFLFTWDSFLSGSLLTQGYSTKYTQTFFSQF